MNLTTVPVGRADSVKHIEQRFYFCHACRFGKAVASFAEVRQVCDDAIITCGGIHIHHKNSRMPITSQLKGKQLHGCAICRVSIILDTPLVGSKTHMFG